MRFAYVRRYGYPWRWWLIAEPLWRLEHLFPHGHFYAWRKAAELRGYRAGHGVAL